MKPWASRWAGPAIRLCIAAVVFALLHVLCAFSSLPVFLVGYFVAGTAANGASFLLNRWLGNELRPLRTRARSAMRDVGRVTRLREQAGGWINLAAGAMIWPVIFMRALFLHARYLRAGALLRSPRVDAMRADASLRPRILFDSTAVLAGAAISYLLTLAGLGTVGPLFVLYALFATLTLLAFSVGPGSFPEVFRRALGRPYLHLLRFGGATAGILVISILALRHGGRAPSTADLRLLADQANEFRRWSALLTFPPRSALDAYLQVNVLLFMTSVWGAARRWKEFRRDDAHLESIAGACTELGRFDEAVAWLRKVRNPRQSTWVHYVPAYLGMGRLDEALDAAGRAVAVDQGELLVVHDDPYALTGTLLLEMHGGREVARPFLARWAAAGADDGRFLLLSVLLRVTGKLDDGDVDQILAAVQRQRHLALTRAGLLMFRDNPAAAARLLRNTSRRPGLAGALRDMIEIFVLIKLDSPDSFDKVDRCIARSLGRFQALAGELNDDFERLGLFAMVSMMAMITSGLDDDQADEWQALRGTIEASITTRQVRRILSFSASQAATLSPARLTVAP